MKSEVVELFEVGERADQGEVLLPESLNIQDEIAIRKERLSKLAEAKAVLEKRAKERYDGENVLVRNKANTF